MGVRRHGVPGSTRVELGQTELQLAGTFLEHVVDDELIDGTVVALLERTYRTPYGSLERTLTTIEGNPLRLVVLVSRSGVQVELGRLLGILGAELDHLVDILALGDMTTTDVERLLG